MRKYSLCVLAVYALLIPFFFVFHPNIFNYAFSYENFGLAALIFICSFFGFLGFLIIKIERPRIRFSGVIWAILYGAVIAFPEEIIFRGIIQNFLQAYTDVAVAILLASVIFGLAHLPNGAKSFRPRDWNWQLAVLAFAAGLPLGLLFYLTNSLLLPTILHALFVVCMQVFSLESKIVLSPRIFFSRH